VARAARRIEDYALIGDCETAALVGRDGAIDWLCWPRFDSEACFAALLGDDPHGTWRIAPCAPGATVRRQYRPGTLVLETVFESADGAVRLLDFMPRRQAPDESKLVRVVEGVRGRVRLHTALMLRFDYGRRVPWISKLADGRVRGVAGPHAIVIETPVPLAGDGSALTAEFEVAAGERVPFVLDYEPSHLPPPDPTDAHAALRDTESWWQEWSGRGRYAGDWQAAVSRSLVTIKALTYRPTGGIVAAPTTSLPEWPGGERNWDYRYCWLRDATFTLRSLINAGYRSEAEAWCNWLLRAVAGCPAQVQPLYGLSGETRCTEEEIGWLPGHLGSRPVRIGNQAHAQLQVDVYGSIMDALHEATAIGLDLHAATDDMQVALLAQLERVWSEPDEGIWEIRDQPRHFVHSKLMAWLAFDRAVASARQFGLAGPVERWVSHRDRIRAEILDRGFDRRRGTFVQAYDAEPLDAALLQLPLLGFLPATDPRVLGTTAAIERELMRDGLLLRYDPSAAPDGLEGEEGAFLACSFWLVDNYCLQGRPDDARRLFESLLSLCNDVGLLAEQYDPKTRAALGNFPQAFSHFALVDTAFNLAALQGGSVDRRQLRIEAVLTGDSVRA
jgi:GH15 family glucan-1,4-alpha-glucosidase